MSDNLKLLRYNTGTDKQVLIKFKDKFSAVIFNATIVAYSRSAVADLVSVHKNQYIIDPQTHIYQQEIKAVQTVDKKTGSPVIKKSVEKYLDELPLELKTEFINKNGQLSPADILKFIDKVVDCVYSFETDYVNKYIKNKEYDKYLEYTNIGPCPVAVIAPYFMIKSLYRDVEINEWMKLNATAAKKMFEKNNSKYKNAIQIVMDKGVLGSASFLDKIKLFYKDVDAEYAFIWVDDFNIFVASEVLQNNFKKLLQILTSMNMKPIMAYGGYDAIVLCNKDLPYKMYGVAQSVGYGEMRPVTPVGGGLPVNKYYFIPLHARLKMSQVTETLRSNGYFSMDKKEASEKFYSHICSCRQCRRIIRNNIDNFMKYNDSSDFTMKNGIKRNRPTTDASLIAAMHFMYSKINEWALVENKGFKQLAEELIDSYNQYDPDQVDSIRNWYGIYEK